MEAKGFQSVAMFFMIAEKKINNAALETVPLNLQEGQIVGVSFRHLSDDCCLMSIAGAH